MNKFNWRQALQFAGVLTLAALIFWSTYYFLKGRNVTTETLVFLVLASAAGTVAFINVNRLNKEHEWFAAAATNRIAKLEALIQKPESEGAREPKTHWPWGAHHTELLGHLEAAAKKFWVLYDPADPGTAPTNKMVARWLRDERGVSEVQAQAIASILRADGLRTGPR